MKTIHYFVLHSIELLRLRFILMRGFAGFTTHADNLRKVAFAVRTHHQMNFEFGFFQETQFLVVIGGCQSGHLSHFSIPYPLMFLCSRHSLNLLRPRYSSTPRLERLTSMASQISSLFISSTSRMIKAIRWSLVISSRQLFR